MGIPGQRRLLIIALLDAKVRSSSLVKTEMQMLHMCSVIHSIVTKRRAVHVHAVHKFLLKALGICAPVILSKSESCMVLL